MTQTTKPSRAKKTKKTTNKPAADAHSSTDSSINSNANSSTNSNANSSTQHSVLSSPPTEAAQTTTPRNNCPNCCTDVALKSVRVFQSVKVGSSELMFIKNVDYDIVLRGQLIMITSLKTGARSVTPLTNVPYFVLATCD